jgi:nucleoid-associated protein YgaU
MRPTAKPSAAPKATPRPAVKVTPSPEATLRPTAKPVLQATPQPAQRPQAKPVPAQRPAATQGGRYVIKRGDTLWDIAAVTLGSPLKWPSLYEANRGIIKRPSLIYPGQTLVIPTGEAATRPSHVRGTHTVRRGETLWEIADSVYGDPLRWKALYQANRGIIKRPSLIYPGQTLLLPR